MAKHIALLIARHMAGFPSVRSHDQCLTFTTWCEDSERILFQDEKGGQQLYPHAQSCFAHLVLESIGAAKMQSSAGGTESAALMGDEPYAFGGTEGD